MKRWVVAFGALALCLLGVLVGLQGRTPPLARFPAPDFALRDLDGRTRRLSDWQGKIIFLNLWATWCPPCRDEMPSMERLYRRLGSDDFAMVAVNEDQDDGAAARRFAEQMRLSFPILLDARGVVPPQYGVTGYPETFIIDRSGHVVRHIVGPDQWDSDSAYQYLRRLTDEGSGRERAPG